MCACPNFAKPRTGMDPCGNLVPKANASTEVASERPPADPVQIWQCTGLAPARGCGTQQEASVQEKTQHMMLLKGSVTLLWSWQCPRSALPFPAPLQPFTPRLPFPCLQHPPEEPAPSTPCPSWPASPSLSFLVPFSGTSLPPSAWCCQRETRSDWWR